MHPVDLEGTSGGAIDDGSGNNVVIPTPGSLHDSDSVTLFRHAERGNASFETGVDDHHIVIEARHEFLLPVGRPLWIYRRQKDGSPVWPFARSFTTLAIWWSYSDPAAAAVTA